VARLINRALAAKDGPIVPLIAETGGINAMVVDSTALPEQVVDAVVQSAFRSAGQRCSALRLLCVHERHRRRRDRDDPGAAKELVAGDPAELAHRCRPGDRREAFEGIRKHLQRLNSRGKMPHSQRRMVTRCYEYDTAGGLRVPSIARRAAGNLRPGAARRALERRPAGGHRWQINALGYGLTLGIQTRIDSRAQALARAAHVGNVYINRNMIGAVVGVQPFGGEGLSGTGPKAGGPHYLIPLLRRADRDGQHRLA
jgi:RHH-type proline utilization regulon transcriptional repressor/proline dehydrogenase/delta 1-pyrroline-5-carboxylate dehydrogenase